MLSTPIAYAVLFITSFLAATLLPLSSELALAALVRSHHTLVAPILVATAGNYVGACTTYWLGQRARRSLEQRRDSSARQHRATYLLQRFGAPALLLSWVPIVGDALVALAGALEIPFATFSLWVLIGKAGRYVVVGWAAYALLG